MATSLAPAPDSQFPTFVPILPSANHRLIPVTAVKLKISGKDIRKMDYHLNESPMSNPAVHNAIAEKLRLLVRANLEVSVLPVRGSAIARIGNETYDLGKTIGRWLEMVYTGLPGRPAEFEVELPLKVISRRVLAVSNPTAEQELRAAV